MISCFYLGFDQFKAAALCTPDALDDSRTNCLQWWRVVESTTNPSNIMIIDSVIAQHTQTLFQMDHRLPQSKKGHQSQREKYKDERNLLLITSFCVLEKENLQIFLLCVVVELLLFACWLVGGVKPTQNMLIMLKYHRAKHSLFNESELHNHGFWLMIMMILAPSSSSPFRSQKRIMHVFHDSGCVLVLFGKHNNNSSRKFFCCWTSYFLERNLTDHYPQRLLSQKTNLCCSTKCDRYTHTHSSSSLNSWVNE